MPLYKVKQLVLLEEKGSDVKQNIISRPSKKLYERVKEFRESSEDNLQYTPTEHEAPTEADSWPASGNDPVHSQSATYQHDAVRE